MSQEVEKNPSLKSQGAWLMFAKIVGFSFSFALPLVIVRLLAKDDFGLYRQAFIVLSNAATILPFGFAMSAFYYLSRDEEKRASAILNILLFNFTVGGLAFAAFFFYPQILGGIFNSNEMTELAPVIGLAIWIWLFSMFLETVAVANQESKLATLFIVFSQFNKTVLMIAAVVIFETVEAIIYAAIIQGIVQTIILLTYLSLRFPKFWLKFDFKFFREHLVYAVPFGLAGILWIAQTDIHYYFVGNKYGEAMLAVYTVGCFQLPLVTILTEATISVLIPRMSELQLKNDVREMMRIIARGMQKLAFFYFPSFVFLFITAETFIVTLFTEKYIDSIPIFLVFIMIMPFQILLSDPVVRAYEKLGRFLLKLRIFTFLVLVSALYFGIQNLSLVGVIGIIVGVRITEMLIAEFVVFKRIGAKLSDLYLLKDVGKTAVVSILAGLATYPVYFFIKGSTAHVAEYLAPIGEYLIGLLFTQTKTGIADFISGSITLGISFAVFSIVYLLLCNLWGLIDKDEKLLVVNLLNKLRKPFGKREVQNLHSQISN